MEDEYEPFSDIGEGRRVKPRHDSDGDYEPNNVVRSSRGRPVKLKQYQDQTDSDEDGDYEPRRSAPVQRPRPQQRESDATTDAAHVFDDQDFAPQPSKAKAPRQRWQPHNPLIMHDDDHDSRGDPIISDDDDEEVNDDSSAKRKSSAESKSKAAAAAAGAGGSVPVRDESGKFIGVRPQTAAERRQAVNGQRSGGGGGGIFKTAAVTVLREERRLMSTGEIARIALKRGYIKVQGRTPEATMASAMYTDVKRKEDRSTFIRPHEGLFGLREWLEEGVDFKDPVDERFPDDTSVGAFKRTRLSSGSIGRPSSRASGNPAKSRRAASPAEEPAPYQQPPAVQGRETIFDRSEFPVVTLPEVALPFQEEVPFGATRGSTEDVSIGLPPRLLNPAALVEATRSGGYPSRAAPAGNAVPARVRGFQPPAASPFANRTSSAELFNNPMVAANGGPQGFAPVTAWQRTSSGGLPNFQRANSAGRRSRKPSLSAPMAEDDEGNIMLLLNAAEGLKSLDRNSARKILDAKAKAASGAGLGGDALLGLGGSLLAAGQRLPGHDRRMGQGSGLAPKSSAAVPQLIVEGFGANRSAANQAAINSQAPSEHPDQVNILNLPLPEHEITQGNMDGPEVPPPNADTDPADPQIGSSGSAVLQSLPSLALPTLPSLPGPLPAINTEQLRNIPGSLLQSPNNIPASVAEAALSALDNSFSSAPLPMVNEPSRAFAPPAIHVPGPNDVFQGSMRSATPSGPSPASVRASAGSPLLASPSGGAAQDPTQRLRQVEAEVEMLEGTMGPRHPKVGKAYLSLSRAYQAVGTPEYYQKAQAALHHAYEICFACQKTAP